MSEEKEVKIVGDEGEASTPETPENVSSPEVKVEEPVVEKTTKSVEELQSQIDNLNIALKEERNISRIKSEKFENQLNESNEINEKLKNVFVPEQESVPEDSSLTREEMEQFYNEKEEQAKQIKVEEERTKIIQTEIKELSEKWDGKEGKPKYDDNKIIQWQQDNNKMYLSPNEAFHAKYRDELIDYEVKQKMAGKNPVENVEMPSAQQPNHVAEEKIPSQQDTKAAVLEAMEKADAEM